MSLLWRKAPPLFRDGLSMLTKMAFFNALSQNINIPYPKCVNRCLPRAIVSPALFNVVCCNHADIVYEFGQTSRYLLIRN